MFFGDLSFLFKGLVSTSFEISVGGFPLFLCSFSVGAPSSHILSQFVMISQLLSGSVPSIFKNASCVILTNIFMKGNLVFVASSD